MRWAEISIDAAPSAVDAVGVALADVGCGGFEVRDAALPPAVAGFLPVDDRLEDRLGSLKDALALLSGYGVEGAGTDLTLRYVEAEDWANAWKAYFKPMRVGRRLVVTPPWEDAALTAGELPLVIDPGMAFGTGSHPTTQLCLVALEEHVEPGQSVADVGTGSGILAIAAARLGAARVAASDIDPLAVRIARENGAVNGVALDVTESLPEGAYDVVVANILADVIIGMGSELWGLTKPGGTLIASGIIEPRGGDVQRALQALGFRAGGVRQQGEWVALVLTRPEPS